MTGTLRRDGEAVELARQADREVADVDHLLHLAEAFLQDLAALQRHETPQRVLVGTQLFPEQAHQLAAARRGDVAPEAEGIGGSRDLAVHRRGIVIGDAADLGAVDGRADDVVAGGGDVEGLEDIGRHDGLSNADG